MPFSHPSDVANTQQYRPAVMAVDDESTILGLVVEVLDELGCEAQAMTRGSDALARIVASPDIDLLITDIRMPGMSGLELAASARRIRPGLPVLFITGYAHEFEHGLDLAPGTTLLIKPFSLAKLGAVVRDILVQRPARNRAPAASA